MLKSIRFFLLSGVSILTALSMAGCGMQVEEDSEFLLMSAKEGWEKTLVAGAPNDANGYIDAFKAINKDQIVPIGDALGKWYLPTGYQIYLTSWGYKSEAVARVKKLFMTPEKLLGGGKTTLRYVYRFSQPNDPQLRVRGYYWGDGSSKFREYQYQQNSPLVRVLGDGAGQWQGPETVPFTCISLPLALENEDKFSTEIPPITFYALKNGKMMGFLHQDKTYAWGTVGTMVYIVFEFTPVGDDQAIEKFKVEEDLSVPEETSFGAAQQLPQIITAAKQLKEAAIAWGVGKLKEKANNIGQTFLSGMKKIEDITARKEEKQLSANQESDILDLPKKEGKDDWSDVPKLLRKQYGDKIVSLSTVLNGWYMPLRKQHSAKKGTLLEIAAEKKLSPLFDKNKTPKNLTPYKYGFYFPNQNGELKIRTYYWNAKASQLAYQEYVLARQENSLVTFAEDGLSGIWNGPAGDITLSKSFPAGQDCGLDLDVITTEIPPMTFYGLSDGRVIGYYQRSSWPTVYALLEFTKISDEDHPPLNEKLEVVHSKINTSKAAPNAKEK